MNKVWIVDYGLSNLLSVARAVEACGGQPVVSADAAALAGAERVILPGVGAFGDGMAALRRLGLDVALYRAAAAGTPLLGICLGMQMLLEQSEEFGLHEGLGLVPGRVVRLPGTDTAGRPQRVPQVGWNGLLPCRADGFADTPLAGTAAGAETYFVHSYEAVPTDAADRLADTLYGERRVCAAVHRRNVTGVQFHPEKSGPVGLDILRRFLAEG